MATVEQRDTQPSGLVTLSNTLDLFNDFKDDKDSDEESFHLPMLDCDDDLDSNSPNNSKENIMNSTDKDAQGHSGETEDEILNKFETPITPDIDPKIEEKLLDEIDEFCEKKPNDENMKVETSTSDKITEDTISSEKGDEELVNENQKTDSSKQPIKDERLDLPSIEASKDVIEENNQLVDKEPVNKERHKKAEGETECINKLVDEEPVNEEPVNESRKDTDDEIKCINKLVDEEPVNEIPKQAEDEIKCVEEENTVEQVDNEINKKDDKIDEPELLESSTQDSVMEELPKGNENIHDIEECSEIKDAETDIANKDAEMDVDTSNVPDEKPIASAQLNEIVKDDNLLNDKYISEETETQKTETESSEMEVDVSEEINQPGVVETKESESVNKEVENKLDVETTKETTINSVQIVPKELENEDQDKNIEKLDDIDESMIVESVDGDEKECIKNSELVEKTDDDNDSPKENIIEKLSDELIEKPIHCEDIDEEKESEEKVGTSLEEKVCNKIEDSTTLTSSIKEKQTNHSKSETLAPERCASSDSNKNLDCDDDLLDISIIRDADEDNASAIAENANDNHSSEKSDNDDQEEGSEKADNELESEMEQEESLLANDKDEPMDFDDGNSSHLAYQDQENTVSGNTSDSEGKDDDVRESEHDSNNSGSVLKEKTNRINDNVLGSEKIQTDELRTELKDADSQSVRMDDQDSLKENSVKVGGKRSLSETDIADATNKKIKLSETVVVNEKKKAKKIKTLVSFEKYMQNKKIQNKLTRSDLEQFCLQKICEAIVHKTDVGELHHTIKKQEQIIENLRKDLQQLTKQTRDLDIVNKKLMNELRAQNGIKKPLVPLKITRSVGLQVKLNVGADNNNARRKTPITVNQRTPSANNNNVRQRTIIPANANVVRQIAASPRKTQTTSTPLLSQALQNNRQGPATPTAATKRPQIRPKPTEPQKPANPGVIDLTDEDDKASKAAAGTPMKMVSKTIPLSQGKNLNMVQNKTIATKTINANNQNKTVAVGQVKAPTAGAKITTPIRSVTALPQGVRLTPTQVKNGSITIPTSVVTSSTGTTQLMYVVQPNSTLGQVVTSTAGGTQKAVLLNFQSTNGVLTSTLNGSAVSVIPTKTTSTMPMQLKTVAAIRKHPAPLPLPPPVAANGSLKPLLPKPHLSIRKTDTGIILQWRMPYNLEIYEGIASYQLFAYQETNAAPSTDMWRKVGDVKALALPMACTLTQFADKNKYYFAVRSVDVHKRIGAFSDPEEISL